jgi:hypothetical protein
MDLAHRLSSELRTAEERAREFEAQANYFRDRAAHAEEWLVRIRREIQETFFDPRSSNNVARRPARLAGVGIELTALDERTAMQLNAPLPRSCGENAMAHPGFRP